VPPTILSAPGWAGQPVAVGERGLSAHNRARGLSLAPRDCVRGVRRRLAEEPTAHGRMRLRWQESGGPPVTRPGRKGFGSRVIEGGLARELDGEVRIDYEPAGVVCQIIMPVSREAVAER
jgi:two-component sensor histidine kinase